MSIKVSDVEGKELAEGYRAGMKDAVVHAHWRKRPISRFYDLVNYWMTGLKPCECSRCECPCGNELMRYCPTCGARMDKEVE